MHKNEVIHRLLNPGLVAILRADSSDFFPQVAEALYEGGVTAMEITMTTPNALKAITEIASRFAGKITIGVGTVIDPETCRKAILAGAEFVVTPVTKIEVIRIANRYEKPIASGAYTPGEALAAHEAGADFVKIFPADQLGPKYIRNILAPLPMLQIIPTGGVTPESAGEFLKAGCVALAAGSTLVTREALARRDKASITARAREFIEAIAKAKAASSPAA